MPINASALIIKTATSPGGNNTDVSLSELPNECPVCHVTIEPEYLGGTQMVAAFDWLEAYYRCTNMKCRRHFTAFYRYTSQNGPRRVFQFERCDPAVPRMPEFDQVIGELSPNFIHVYAESITAEDQGLTEIAGPGFRKSLEFLIKDYAIQLSPQNEAEIKQIPLAKVVKEYLPGDKLTVVSSRAVWIGNDETHYERRWIGKDLQDLKKLINATVHFIAMERLAADLPTDMPATGPAVPQANS